MLSDVTASVSLGKAALLTQLAQGAKLSWKGLMILLVLGLGLTFVARFLPSGASDNDRVETVAGPQTALTHEDANRSEKRNISTAIVDDDQETIDPVDVSSVTTSDPANDENALTAATMRALASGRSENWEAADGMHFITVSVAQQVGNRTCRTVTHTLPAGENAAASQSTWCTTDEGKWELAR